MEKDSQNRQSEIFYFLQTRWWVKNEYEKEEGFSLIQVIVILCFFNTIFLFFIKSHHFFDQSREDLINNYYKKHIQLERDYDS